LCPVAVTILLAALPSLAAAAPTCQPTGARASLDQVVARIEAEGIRYVFVGEHHAVGPAKRFAVDTANALTRRGHDVGLYVEGFRTDCDPSRTDCHSLAGLFNREAFGRLLVESLAPVHPIDPPGREARVARMAASIADGTEAIRVVLVGRSHVVHAGNPDAELWVYGGGARYPDPGDLAEFFPRDESLTVSLEVADEQAAPYTLRFDGCDADYALMAGQVTGY
jgi:hypothetical protein